MCCYLVSFHTSVRVQRAGSRPYDVTDLFLSVQSPLAHAPFMWRPCQVDHLTLLVADGIAPGPADDLVRPEVLDTFVAGRAECSPTLRFSDNQDQVGQSDVQAPVVSATLRFQISPVSLIARNSAYV